MKHTKEQILDMIKKLLSDLKQEHITTEEINIGFEKNLQINYTQRVLPNGWWASVTVHDEWFNNEGGILSIYINDDSGNIEGYLDGSSGRPVPMCAKKDPLGKYYLEVISQ